MITLLLLACMSHDDHLADVLGDVDDALAMVDTMVADHGEVVAGAASVEAVAAEESTFAAGWTQAAADLRAALEMVEGCAMDDEDRAALEDALGAMDGIDAAAATHATTMGACASVEECAAAETQHAATITGYTDQIRADREGWEDGTVECVMDDMGHDEEDEADDGGHQM